MNPFPKIEYMWVNCHKCDTPIERVKTLANRNFTCYDCKRLRHKTYDASPKRVQARKDYRVVKRVETVIRPLSPEEQEAVDRFNARKRRNPSLGAAFRYQYKSANA